MMRQLTLLLGVSIATWCAKGDEFLSAPHGVPAATGATPISTLDLGPLGTLPRDSGTPASRAAAGADVAHKLQADSVADALKSFQNEVGQLLRHRDFQWAIAFVSCVFGFVALLDGRRSLKWLVVVAVGLATLGFQLRQFQPAGRDEMTATALYVAALEISLFMGYVVYQGWEGAQILIGFVLGMYLFDVLCNFASLIPYFDSLAQQVPVMVGLLSLTVLMSMLAIHEKHGGRKVLGVLAPIVGSGLIVSGIGWLAIASCSLSDPLPIGVTVAPADVPSVIEFWNMIVFPTSSKAVGVFGAGDKFLVIGDAKYSLDRVTGVFFWIVFFLLGMRYQTKGDGGISVLTGAQRNLQDLNDQLEHVQANTRGLGSMMK